MTAITWSRPDAGEGVTPFDARYHLRDVAELIGSVFADELDASGRGALHEMQLVGRLSPFLGSLLSTAFFNDFVLGYVWVEGDKIVGNVTFQRADFAGTRWRISNVAVTPGYRQRGIARALMNATLREIAQRGGNWSLLQVRADNAAARRLYENLGFTDVCQDGVWRREAESSALPDSPPLHTGGLDSSRAPGEESRGYTILRPLRAMHWQARLDLARSARSHLANWAEPLQMSDYQLSLPRLVSEAFGNLTGIQRTRRWGIWLDGSLTGAVEVVIGIGAGPHRVRFDTRPEMSSQLAPILVEHALQVLQTAPRLPIVAEHSADDDSGVSALADAGFRAQRILVTMRRPMTVADL